MDPSKWTDWIKLSPRYLLGLCLASGAILFGREQWLASLGVETLVAEYRIWIGLVFLVSASLLISQGVAGVLPASRKWVDERRRLKWSKRRLHDLTTEEKQVLGDYIQRKSRTQVLLVNNGVVAGLMAEGVLYRASNLSSRPGPNFDVNIQPWAWEYLVKNPELVE
jgi:hypothetical protein